MATSIANFKRNGYGQVEPNHLSGIRTGQSYAQLPLDTAVNVLQNGEFMYYDYAAGKVSADDSTSIAEPMLVYNEVKIYEDILSYKDFAMIRVGDNYVTHRPFTGTYEDGALNVGVAPVPSHTEYGYQMDGICPRMVKTNVGDIMTTNMVKPGVQYTVGDLLVPVKDATSKTLVLEKAASGVGTGMAWVVAKTYTMPDGQDGLKLQRVQ